MASLFPRRPLCGAAIDNTGPRSREPGWAFSSAQALLGAPPYTNPKRQRGESPDLPRWRFGLIWADELSHPTLTYHAAAGRAISCGGLFPTIVDGPGDLAFKILPADDAVDEAVFEQEFAGLKALGQLDANRGLDGARPGEAD